MTRRKNGKILVALVLCMVMAVTFVIPAFGATQLAAPVVTQNQSYRWLFYIPVEGATGYNVYAFATFEDAQEGTNYVAVARNVVETEGSTSTGGTTGGTAPEVPDGHNRIDVRLIQFEGEATRTLPTGYIPGGIGDSFYPGDRQGDTTNLKPGQYWFRLRAISSEDNVTDSELSAVNELPFTIAMGPSELRAYLEANLDRIGTPTLRLVDLRNPAEFADEGNMRFFEEADRYVWADFDTQEKAEEIFGTDKSITIIVVCRGGGRTVTASQNLARFGFTNVINAQGVNQWTYGLMFDDPTFALRGPGHSTANPVAPFITDNTITWLNVPRAAFEILAFDNAEETDPEEAVHSAEIPAMPQDVTGTNAERLWVKTFDLSEMGVADHQQYYIRMRAIPSDTYAVRGYTPATNWGAPSLVSDVLGGLTFEDVVPGAWYFPAVMYVYDEGIMEGFPEGGFMPETPLTRAQIVTILYRMAGSPEVAGLANPFEDVAAGDWWTPQILWAYDTGVTTGFLEDGVRTFRGNQYVTMEELAAFIARDQEATDRVPMPVLADFVWPDFDDVRPFAKEYVGRLTAQGLFRDLPGTEFEPRSAASRATVASVLYHWLTAL
ncbi:MAG: S-layer homology domain-containing protein [Oscillospiraceae bacterium]|nr:S-layer homology domain-containing protein [Oscillospiraceae bacterium]